MMARVLFAWELGGGTGHLAPHRATAEALRNAGHEVLFAVRDLATARRLLPGEACTATPALLQRRDQAPQVIRSYAQILLATGFDDPELLAGLVWQWRRLFRDFRPDLVILDHAPAALLALRGLEINTVTKGAGFFHPPNAQPLPDLRPWLPADNEALAVDEERVVAAINRVLAAERAPGIDSVSCLFRGVAAALTTYQALDPYRRSPGRTYVGTPAVSGAPLPPAWPAGRGPRAFCYLSPGPAAVAILRQLLLLGCPTLFAMGRGTRLGMTLPNNPLLARLCGHADLQHIANSCEFAVLEGNHFTTAEFLRAGKPILQAPLTLDQTHVALSTHEIGAGVMAPSCQAPTTVMDFIARLPRFKQAAEEFARHARALRPEPEAEQLQSWLGPARPQPAATAALSSVPQA